MAFLRECVALSRARDEALENAVAHWTECLAHLDAPEQTVFEVAYKLDVDSLELIAELDRRGTPTFYPPSHRRRTPRAVNRWLCNLDGQRTDGTVTDVARLFELAPEALHAAIRRRGVDTVAGGGVMRAA